MRAVDHDLASVDFPIGEIPIGVGKGIGIEPRQVSGNSETRIRVCRIRDLAKSDFSIEQREIIRRVLWV